MLGSSYSITRCFDSVRKPADARFGKSSGKEEFSITSVKYASIAPRVGGSQSVNKAGNNVVMGFNLCRPILVFGVQPNFFLIMSSNCSYIFVMCC